jgi:hypothetical protein
MLSVRVGLLLPLLEHAAHYTADVLTAVYVIVVSTPGCDPVSVSLMQDCFSADMYVGACRTRGVQER